MSYNLEIGQKSEVLSWNLKIFGPSSQKGEVSYDVEILSQKSEILTDLFRLLQTIKPSTC